jgi:PAS domain S-box-containing protein
VPGVIIGLSSTGIIIEFNPEAEKVFKRKRNEVIGGNYFDLFIPEPLRKKVESDMKQILSDGLPNRFENLVKSATGDQLNIEWTAHKLFDEKGILTGIITIGENITKL